MTTLPEKLKSAGYRTFMAGKWHAGGYAFGQVPGQRGFDYSIGYLDGKEDHYTHYMGMLGAYDFWQTNNVSYGYKGIYGDSIYVNKSVEFIHNVTTADKDEPIFMYIAFRKCTPDNFDCFDGGVKAVSFLSGPVLPSAVKGTRSSALVHIADWYATFASLAKVDPWDNTTAVPPSDGLNVWPALTKEQPSPRTEIVLCEKAILSGRYKLVNEYRYDGYSGPAYPETPITPAPPCPKDGCLFDIERDPRETTDLSDTYPQIKKDLLAKLQNASATFFQTGDDGYKGKFTDCKPFHEILNMTDGYGAPLCYEPKHHPNNIKGK
ncbi:hypothetical protein PTSG_08687 [Salpingoeca rosetta]|uniref:Sulfatase N-terminal domain-containing protein n=1 Tax=Salpingoeca rosetta (strain ATCC 50818 / BSB-021) TaxID=946362 RepID=F2UKE1_SALR5|nr:uncharacterized protein PTSG_08687 [Salpingoeca rosetta]EGD77590.1 hypothetical protein PTSG_08687 [Salpingoeca rosetta]|eukprot:XP_004990478.1 hypothetical protein PTSG_08687 [Salpingoeca rosetta]